LPNEVVSPHAESVTRVGTAKTRVKAQWIGLVLFMSCASSGIAPLPSGKSGAARREGRVASTPAAASFAAGEAIGRDQVTSTGTQAV
jgi:hypothetical protein